MITLSAKLRCLVQRDHRRNIPETDHHSVGFSEQIEFYTVICLSVVLVRKIPFTQNDPFFLNNIPMLMENLTEFPLVITN